jgi:hypothetical protein
VQYLKARLHMPFPHAENAVRCILLILTLVWTNQCNYLEIATQCGKRMRKRHGCLSVLPGGIVALFCSIILSGKDVETLPSISRKERR